MHTVKVTAKWRCMPKRLVYSFKMDVVPFHSLANDHLECLPVGEHQQRAVTQHYWEPKLSPKNNVVKYSARRYSKKVGLIL